MHLEIWPPSDIPSITAAAHVECFNEAKDPSIMPDPQYERGRIPPKATCVLCGKKLPIIGRHPFALVVHGEEATGRYWVHAGCMEEKLDLGSV
jgi:hypothetical protein